MVVPRSPLPLLLCLLFVLAGCGGGDGDADEAPVAGGGWIYITVPTPEPTYIDFCNSSYLAGDAFISPEYSHCCSGSAEDTGVTVSWYNASTGVGGAALQQVEICYLLGQPYLCNHSWSATVPLAIGVNEIRVTATDPGGRTGTDTIGISHPETSHMLSGSATTDAGVGLAYRESAIDLSLSDGLVTQRTVTSLDGSYRFDCVRDGAYVITPSSPIAYSFSPPAQHPVVAGADVADLNFTTSAWFVSGQVVLEGGLGLPGMLVEVAGADSLHTQLTDQGGNYRFALPSGGYTLRAYDYWGYYDIAPSSRSVVVVNEDIILQPFVAVP